MKKNDVFLFLIAADLKIANLEKKNDKELVHGAESLTLPLL